MYHKNTSELMKTFKITIFLLFLIFKSCFNNEVKKESIETTFIKEEIVIGKDRQLQFLYFTNGGLIGYFDDGTIVGCPRCDLMEKNINTLKNKDPHSEFIIEKDVLITLQGDTIPIKSMKSNEWAIVNYKSSIINKSKEDKITEVALSFHVWYIENTNEIQTEIATDFVVTEGKNNNCIIDYQPYFNELHKLGTISKTFMNNEKERTKLCSETISKMKWSDYTSVLPKNCDDYLYWTKRQDVSESVDILYIEKKDSFWNATISINQTEQATVKIEDENGEYMITAIKWNDK